MRRRRPLAWSFGALALLFGLAFTFRWIDLDRRARHQRKAAAAIKFLTVAEVDFRSNDRDGNKINDFWTGDVAGLYSICPPNDLGPSEPIQLIARELAEADAAPLQPLVPEPRPYHGYFFRAMLTDENGDPYAAPSGVPDGRGAAYNTSKFAFCAFPADATSGQPVFIVNEGNTIFKRTPSNPILKFPQDDYFPLSLPRATSYEPPPPGALERLLDAWTRTDDWLLAFGLGGLISLGGWGSLLVAPSRPRVALAFPSLALAAAALLAVGAHRHELDRIMAQNEEHAAVVLNHLANTNHQFRSENWNRNDVSDFWTEDVASLVLHPSNAPFMAGINRNLADADGANAVARPYRGYLYRAVPVTGDGARHRFAFCAYPSDYGRSGRLSFLIDEGRLVLRRDTGGRPVLEMPSSGDGWERMSP